MPIKLANNAVTTIRSSISSSDTGIALAVGSGNKFPSLGTGDYFYATLSDTNGNFEIVRATARSGDSLVVVRAQEGTAAFGFAANSRIELRVTAQSVIDALSTATNYQGASAANPTTRLDGLPLVAGDFYFNTVDNQVRFYNGSAWVPLATSALKRDDFTGNGTDTTFTLSLSPSTEDNTQVYINGVYQEKSGYSVSGTSLVFLVAPPAGSTIEVITIENVGIPSADLVGYQPAGTGAVGTDVQAKLRETVSVKDFGAKGDGVTDDTVAFNNAKATGKLLWVPLSTGAYTFSAPVTNDQAAFFPEPTLSWKDFTDSGKLSWLRGFYSDGVNSANVWRFRDRVMVGDAADYSGNRLGANDYGNTWVIDKGASYLVKNATMAVAAPELDELGVRRYGLVGFSKSMGVGAITVNDGASTFARGLYAEGFHETTVGGATVGIEIQMGNYTNRFPVANSYTLANVETSALFIGAESGAGYTVGDGDTPITPATQPCGAAIDISGGSLGADYQKWVAGIVFRNGGLYRDVNDFAVAMSLAQKHQISWYANTTTVGASIWSEVTVGTGAVGLKFADNKAQFLGVNNRLALEIADDIVGAGAVNYPVVKNSRTGLPVSFGAFGTDTNVSVDIFSKAQGVIRLMSHGGIGENLRITPPVNAPTDYLTVQGSAGGGVATIGVAGASADIDINIATKGVGLVRFGAFTSNADAPVNGYITIRDAGGTLRKLATIA
jgi:hypothetical protein